MMMHQKGTTRESLNIETGPLDPSTVQHKQEIMMNYRLTYSTNERMRTSVATTVSGNQMKTLI